MVNGIQKGIRSCCPQAAAQWDGGSRLGSFLANRVFRVRVASFSLQQGLAPKSVLFISDLLEVKRNFSFLLPEELKMVNSFSKADDL